MKVKILLCLIVVFNVIFWALSEVYLHNGTFYSGAFKGAIVSAFCVILPFLIWAAIDELESK